MIGVAWDPTGKGDWAVRGGFGIYNNWLTQANVQEEFRGSPPGLVMPTFFRGGTATAQAPIFVLGTGDKPPFGFTFPTFQGGLNSQGGVVWHRLRDRWYQSAPEIAEIEYLVGYGRAEAGK